MGYWEDLARGAQAATSDPRETATPHVMASIPPPPGVASMTPDEARAFLQSAADERMKMGISSLDTARKANYARTVVAADMAARGYVAPGPEDTIGRKGTRWVMNALDWPLDKVQRGLSTLGAVGNEAESRSTTALNVDSGYWGAIFSKDTWSKGWEESKGISPGQAALASTDESKGDLRQRLEASRTWGQETWEGRLSTGTLDFATNVFLDPTLALGKVTKASKVGQFTVMAGEVEDTLKAADAAIAGTKAVDVSRSSTKAGQAMARFIQETDGKTVSQMLQMKPFQKTSDAGLYAHLFAQVNTSDLDEAARYAAKRDIMAAAMGSTSARAKLAERHAELEAQLARVQIPPELNQLPRYWKASVEGGLEEVGPIRFTVDHQGEINFLNQPRWEAELRAAEEKITAELQLLNRRIETAGEMKVVASRGLERLAEKGRVRSASSERVIYNSALGRTITVIGGKAGAKAPHAINIADTTRGMEDMTTALRRSKWMPRDVQDRWLGKYAAAGSAQERARIVDAAEAESHKYLAQSVGVNPDEAQALLDAAKGAREQWKAYIRSKAFSAAPSDSKIVSGVGPDGNGFAFDLPFLQSQLRDTASFMDPDVAKKAMLWAKKHKIGTVLADASRTKSEALADIGSAALAGYMSAWKFAALFRLAYMPRVQIDSQLRNLAAMGGLAYAASVGHGTVNFFKNINPLDRKLVELEGGATKNAVRRGREDRASLLTREQEFDGVTWAPAKNYDELLKRERMTSQNGQSLGQYMTDRTVSEHRRLLGNAEWDITPPSAPNWVENYLRGVNRQIRNSPTALAVAAGMNDETITRLATRSQGPIRDEWLNFNHMFETPVDWVNQAVRPHIEHMLPNRELRDIIQQRNVTQADVNKFFPSANERFSVHGEAYNQYGKTGPIGEAYRKVQQFWFKWMSDVPEQVMARQPLYVHEFNSQMRDKIARWTAENEGKRVPEAELELMRRSADKLARKRVNEVLFDLERMSPGSGMRTVLFPFFSAWEDTMKKWGKLLYEDPSLIQRTNQAFAAPANSGLIVEDDPEAKRAWLKKMLGREPTEQELATETGRYLYLPKSWLKHFGVSDDFTFKVDPKSLNIVFQGNPPLTPGVGPLVQVSASWMANNDPDIAAIVDKNPAWRYVLPFGADPAADDPFNGIASSLVPGWAKSFATAFGNGDKYADTYNMLRNTEFSRYNRGLRDTKPTADEIGRKTRNYFLITAVSQYGMPISVRPGPSQELQFYIDQSHEINRQWRLSHPDGKKLSEDDPYPSEIMYERYPEFFDLSISLSENTTGIEATIEAQTAAEKYKRAIVSTPAIGWAIAGPDNLKGEFNSGVYDYQRSKSIGAGSDKTYRGKKDPRENFDEPDIRRGWAEYYKARARVDAELDARGLTSISQKGATDLRNALAGWRNELAKRYPAWGVEFGKQNSSRVLSFITDVQKAWELYPELKERRDMKLLQEYIISRQQLNKLLKERPKSRLTDPSNSAIAQAWGAYVKSLTDQDLAFSYMYSRVLEGDDVNKELLGLG